MEDIAKKSLSLPSKLVKFSFVMSSFSHLIKKSCQSLASPSTRCGYCFSIITWRNCLLTSIKICPAIFHNGISNSCITLPLSRSGLLIITELNHFYVQKISDTLYLCTTRRQTICYNSWVMQRVETNI